MAVMKATVQNLMKGSKEKKACIKLHEEKLPCSPDKCRSGQPDPSQKALKVTKGKDVHPK